VVRRIPVGRSAGPQVRRSADYPWPGSNPSDPAAIPTLYSRSLTLAPIESAYMRPPMVIKIGPMPRFRYIAGFLLRATPPLFHPNFGGVPLADVVAPRSEETLS